MLVRISCADGGVVSQGESAGGASCTNEEHMKVAGSGVWWLVDEDSSIPLCHPHPQTTQPSANSSLGVSDVTV